MNTKLFFTGLTLILFTAVASGQKSDTADKQLNNSSWGPAFVDKNNDGVCDNFENRGTRPGCGRAYFRNGGRYGNNRGNAYRGGNGPAKGRGQGRGQGRFYVDKDNNGICDNFESSSKK